MSDFCTVVSYSCECVNQMGFRSHTHTHTDVLRMFYGTSKLKSFQCRSRGQLKFDGTRAETRFRLLAKWTSPFKLAGASVQSTTGSGGVCISGSNAGYTMFRGSVKSTGYPLHLPVSPSLPLPCVDWILPQHEGVQKSMFSKF
jgi:hypothetical protein